jgi:anti-anti-sigma factor
MDLRLHTRAPDVVIVRVSGSVNTLTARLLAELAGKQLHRAPHVIIDLGNVSVLGTQGVAVLLLLHQQALARGTQLHIVGAGHDAVRHPLHIAGLAQLLSPDSTADGVIAGLPRPAHRPARDSGSST